jgi:hypothetical protein
MKKYALMALVATVMVAPYAMSSASGTRVSDTPECCVKKQGCCPGASCCSGGKHSMGAQCMLHAAAN